MGIIVKAVGSFRHKKQEIWKPLGSRRHCNVSEHISASALDTCLSSQHMGSTTAALPSDPWTRLSHSFLSQHPFSTERPVAGFLFLWISTRLGFPCFSTCQSVRHIMSTFSDSQRKTVSEALAPSYASSLGWPGTSCTQLKMVPALKGQDSAGSKAASSQSQRGFPAKSLAPYTS